MSLLIDETIQMIDEMHRSAGECNSCTSSIKFPQSAFGFFKFSIRLFLCLYKKIYGKAIVFITHPAGATQ